MQQRSNWTLAALAAPSLALAGLGLPLAVYLPEFYANEMQLNLSLVGFAFMAVRLLDIAFDPWIGGIMDRTRTRFGRFRPWFVISAPILMLAAYMLFMPKAGVGIGYLWFWLLVIYAGFSIATLSQVSWGAVLSPNYDERSRIYAWWQGGNILGMILVLALPPLLAMTGVKGDAAGVAAMGWYIVLLAPLTVALAISKVPEPAIAKTPDRAGLKEYFALFRIPVVRRLLLADLLVGAGPAVLGALFFFYFEHVKGFDKVQAGQLMLLNFVFALLGGPLWAWLATRIGKHKALAVAGGVQAVAILTTSLIPVGQFPAAIVIMFLMGVPSSAGAFLLRAMMADVGDKVRLETGQDRTGLLFALLNGTVKIGSALAIGVSFIVLDVAGFDPTSADAATGIGALQVFYLGVPSLFFLASGLVALGYPLTAHVHADIRRRLEELDDAALAKADAALEVAGVPPVVEDIHAPRPAQ